MKVAELMIMVVKDVVIMGVQSAVIYGVVNILSTRNVLMNRKESVVAVLTMTK
jgi:hypothetical protein